MPILNLNMKYNTIKTILRNQVKGGVRALWTFDELNKEFTMIYNNYNNKLRIYTPQQLLDKLK